jgi:hypothetical protein
METKGFGNWGASLLGIIASWKLLFANPSLQFVDFSIKLVGALLLVFFSCLANLWAKDIYAHRIKPKLFKNDRSKEDDKAA